MALVGILFKDGSMCVKRPRGENNPSPYFSFLSKRENTIEAIYLEYAHIERGGNFQLCTLKRGETYNCVHRKDKGH
jgi:hypothetical protein